MTGFDVLCLVTGALLLFVVMGVIADGYDRRDAWQRHHGRRRVR